MFSSNPQRGKKEFSGAKIQSKKLSWLLYISNKIENSFACKAQHTTKCTSSKRVPPFDVLKGYGACKTDVVPGYFVVSAVGIGQFL